MSPPSTSKPLNSRLLLKGILMNIQEIKKNRIEPFNVDDIRLIKLFSFFLSSAPTIDSQTAAVLDENRLAHNWNNYIQSINQKNRIIISPNTQIEKYLEKYELSGESKISRRQKGFVCKRKDKHETDYQCVLRHIRNAIAHSNIFLSNAGNRKYIYLEDFNQSKNQSAAMLFSQADLMRLKKEIMK